jgi:hypothetical protein
MSINMSRDNVIPKNIPNDADAYYETVASQEEIYLEETEEELRAILISEDPSTYVQRESGCVDCCFVAESLDEELCRAAEELITGDSDDPPLSEKAVAEMLRVSRLYSLRSL